MALESGLPQGLKTARVTVVTSTGSAPNGAQGHRDAGGADSRGGQLGHGRQQRLSRVGVAWWVQLAWEMTAIASKASKAGRSVKSPAIRCR